MSLTTSQIATQFKRLYKESSTRYFDNNWLITAINDSCEDLWDELINVNPEYAPVKMTNLSYITNQQEYVLPTDMEQVQKVEVNDLSTRPYPVLMKIMWSDFGSYTFGPFEPGWNSGGFGEPLSYYVRFMESGQTPVTQSSPLTADSWIMGFDPIPDRTGTNNINVWYTGTVSAVTGIDSELPDLSPDFHDLIPRRMCIFAAIADQSPTLSFYQSVYNDSLLRKLNRVVRSPNIVEERIEVDFEDMY